VEPLIKKRGSKFKKARQVGQLAVDEGDGGANGTPPQGEDIGRAPQIPTGSEQRKSEDTKGKKTEADSKKETSGESWWPTCRGGVFRKRKKERLIL